MQAWIRGGVLAVFCSQASLALSIQSGLARHLLKVKSRALAQEQPNL